MRVLLVSAALAVSLFGCSSGDRADDARRAAPERVAPDDTARNAGDGGVTASDQSNAASDLRLTQRIRQAIVADGAISTAGRNVKIITVAGQVTLRGPVASGAERESIAAKAVAVAGPGRVTNELEPER
ncbi:MAG TPA: BON domain-containing protein [Candidatus Binatia bacterium]|nr:BON domain-containing protein [Candidatus Binatia bacterium]